MRCHLLGIITLSLAAASGIALAHFSPPENTMQREIETLPEDRGGQELIGRAWPAMKFDRIIEMPRTGEAASDTAQSSERDDEQKNFPRITLYRWWTNGCPYCTSSLPAIEQWRNRYESRGLRTIAVYHPKPPRDAREVPDAFIIRAANSIGYGGTLALDSDWSQLRAATRGWQNRRATSVSFLVDHAGIIRFVHPGLDYFPSEEQEHARQDRDHELLEAAIEALLRERNEAIQGK